MENSATTPNTETKIDTETATTPKTYTVKHNKDTIEIPDDKVIPLLQKGLDYDIKVQKLRELEGSKALQFLESQAQKSGKSRDELAELWEKEFTQREINQFAETNDLSPEVAQRLLEAEQIKQRDKEEKAETERKTKASQAKREKQSAELTLFQNTFPDVDVSTLPDAVLEEWIEGGIPLKTVYKAYQADELKARLSEMEQKNKD